MVLPPRVLIVDDDDNWLTLMVRKVHKVAPSAEIITAVTFKSAIPYILAREVEFCITDLVLPDGSGSEIVQLCEANGIAACIMTAHTIPSPYAEDGGLIISKANVDPILDKVVKIPTRDVPTYPPMDQSEKVLTRTGAITSGMRALFWGKSERQK